jgi:cytochrome oxidase Cu insertion factor (SCO1/SenC/PrrC family)
MEHLLTFLLNRRARCPFSDHDMHLLHSLTGRPVRSFAMALTALTLAACAGQSHTISPAAGKDETVLTAHEWTTESGVGVAILDYKGNPFIITGVETSCISHCPITFEKLRRVDRSLRSHGVAANVLLVALDPTSKSPDELARWKAARHMPQHWHVLSGTDPGTRAFERYFDVGRSQPHDHAEHDVQIALFDSDGRQTHTFHGLAFDPDEAISAAR